MKKSDILGCIYIVSLLGAIIGIDRMIFKHFQEGIFFGWFWQPMPGWLGRVTFLLVMAACISFWLIKKEEHKPEKATRDWRDKVRLVVANSCSGSVLDILVVISFVAFMAWLPDSISDYVKGDGWLFRPFLYAAGLVLLIYGKPSGYKRIQNIKAEERRLLVTGLSNVNVSLVEKKQMAGSKRVRRLSFNLMPIIMPLKKYPCIEKIKVLLSRDMLDDVDPEGYERFRQKYNPANYRDEKDKARMDAMNAYYEGVLKIKESLDTQMAGLCEKEEVQAEQHRLACLHLAEDKIAALVYSFIRIEYPEYELPKIEFSEPVDYNDFNVCNKECFRFLKNDMDHHFSDYQVVVNITPGTKPVGSALTINAIKGEREMISINQKTNEIDVCEANVSLVQMNGWIEEHDRNL